MQPATLGPPKAPASTTVGVHNDPSVYPGGLVAALRHQMSLVGTQSGAYVYDMTAGHEVFSLRGQDARVPASVEKLYTSAVALAEFGPQARFQTEILGRGHRSGSTWHGDLYLRGGGDPTFGSSAFDAMWNRGLGATDRTLAARLKREAGIRRVTGKLYADGSLFDALRGGPSTGDRPDVLDLGGELGGLTYNHGASALSLATTTAQGKKKRPPHVPASPGAFAAAQVAETLRADGIAVTASPHESTETPPSAQVLARVSSPPLATILRLMNLPSDDFYAETLLKQLGARFGGAGTTAAGAAVVTRALAGIGVHPHVVDGSGLSRANRSTPLDVVRVLEAVERSAYANVLRESLPVPGRSGTLSRRVVAPAARDGCVGKTGSLIGVFNLAGYCTAPDGHLLAYAIFMDGPDTITQRNAQDGMLSAMATRVG